MSKIIDMIICYPFGAILKFIYEIFNSYGVAIILFTVLTKLIMLPFAYRGKKSSMDIQALQPKLAALQKQYANNKQKYQEEVAKLYQSEGINPTASCLPTFITFPILIGLYYVVIRPLTFFMGLSQENIIEIATRLSIEIPENLSMLKQMEMEIASKMQGHIAELIDISPNIMEINFNFLGMNLGAKPTWNSLLVILPILSAVTAFLLNRISLSMQKKMQNGAVSPAAQNNMIYYIMPIFSIWFGFTFPAGVVIYWIVSNITACIQEYFMGKMILKKKQSEDEKRALENKIRNENKKQLTKKKKAHKDT